MAHRHRSLTTLAAALLSALTLSACNRAPVTPHDALGAGAEPLRTHFNQDAAYTRIVLLAAPT